MSIKVLAIDDDTIMAEVLAVLLKAHGFDVAITDNGADGINQIKETSPDLVILDLMMADLDGWEVCKRVREFSNVPILVLSALDSSETVTSALDAGADDYLIKPVPSGVLVAHLNTLTRRSNPKNNINGHIIFPLPTIIP